MLGPRRTMGVQSSPLALLSSDAGRTSQFAPQSSALALLRCIPSKYPKPPSKHKTGPKSRRSEDDRSSDGEGSVERAPTRCATRHRYEDPRPSTRPCDPPDSQPSCARGRHRDLAATTPSHATSAMTWRRPRRATVGAPSRRHRACYPRLVLHGLRVNT
ncbi:hypothetical protein K523DRAFT_119080 [Schizophyllum commune Tattone D]|nr:hypothetical protein K523DRAFT_119080 [Schizophyllum commune Tattone D]